MKEIKPYLINTNAMQCTPFFSVLIKEKSPMCVKHLESRKKSGLLYNNNNLSNIINLFKGSWLSIYGMISVHNCKLVVVPCKYVATLIVA